MPLLLTILTTLTTMTPLLLLLPLALAAPDQSSSLSKGLDSYTDPVGTSYTVPLTASYVAPVSKETRKYSVSADDLERADSSDLSVSSSLTAPVFSGAYKPEAEARDGAGGHHHGHHGGPQADHGHHADHSASAPAVAPAAPEPVYEAQAPVSTGNLYYYYYPVQPEVIADERVSEELDPLVLVLLPITILVGILAVLSVFNVSVTGRASSGRSFGEGRETGGRQGGFGSFEQFKAEVDRMLERYYHALESESCMDRVVCELGTKAKDLSGKNMLMTALDWIIPAHMSSRISTFKAAANEGFEVHHCKQKFYCDSERLIQTTRK